MEDPSVEMTRFSVAELLDGWSKRTELPAPTLNPE
jgi:hypothetical protein